MSYLACTKYFGLPISVSRPVERNVNDEECLPLVWVSKGCVSLLLVQNDVHMNQNRTKSSCHDRELFGYRQKRVKTHKDGPALLSTATVHLVQLFHV